ncbi:hypothetical protein PR048_004739 [Dryococelus australis]|uniref:Vomeronasal type-1 receptor n=1 Tax=Dryococelus australis TaxID=614101 RepID=A0ABQ9I672_9NEOP|nr:hypothetical protein PR048_004739 [Dryococelus australis]
MNSGRMLPSISRNTIAICVGRRTSNIILFLTRLTRHLSRKVDSFSAKLGLKYDGPYCIVSFLTTMSVLLQDSATNKFLKSYVSNIKIFLQPLEDRSALKRSTVTSRGGFILYGSADISFLVLYMFSLLLSTLPEQLEFKSRRYGGGHGHSFFVISCFLLWASSFSLSGFGEKTPAALFQCVGGLKPCFKSDTPLSYTEERRMVLLDRTSAVWWLLLATSSASHNLAPSIRLSAIPAASLTFPSRVFTNECSSPARASVQSTPLRTSRFQHETSLLLLDILLGPYSHLVVVDVVYSVLQYHAEQFHHTVLVLAWNDLALQKAVLGTASALRLSLRRCPPGINLGQQGWWFSCLASQAGPPA